MIQVGRYTRVRAYDPGRDRWGLPYVLDQGRAQARPRLVPYRTEEWVAAEARRADRRAALLRAIRGGSFNFERDWASRLRITPALWGNPTARTLALDSAYTFNSAGDAIGFRVRLFEAKTLAAVYFYISSSTGTAANVNDIDFELRNDNGSHTSPNRSSPTLHTSGSMNPNADSTFVGWHKIDPADFAMTADTTYWVIFADADGNGSDFATLQHDLDGGPIDWSTFELLGAHDLYPWTTANGFSTDASDAVRQAVTLVMEFTDGSVKGNCFDSGVQTASDTHRKGLRLEALTAALVLRGVVLRDDLDGQTGAEVYTGDTTPGSPDVGTSNHSSQATASTRQMWIFSPGVTLQAGVAHRIVCTGNFRVNGLINSSDNGHGSILRKARGGGSDRYLAYAQGTTDWANDSPGSLPHVSLLFEDQVAAAGAPLHGTPGAPPSH